MVLFTFTEFLPEKWDFHIKNPTISIHIMKTKIVSQLIFGEKIGDFPVRIAAIFTYLGGNTFQCMWNNSLVMSIVFEVDDFFGFSQNFTKYCHIFFIPFNCLHFVECR